MKLTLILLVAGFLQVSASVYSQSVKFSFNLKNQKVIEVLNEIEDNSEFRFFYQNEQIDLERRVTVKSTDAGIDKILSDVFEGTDVTYTFKEEKLILLTLNKTNVTSQQEGKITGKVVDDQGEVLPGTTVYVKGTSNGTVTNANGVYELYNVKPNDVVVFSFIGMSTLEEAVNSRTSIDVTMTPDAFAIEEIVTVAYGTQKRENLTGAVEQVSGEVLESRPITNISDGLSNRIAGLNIKKSNGAPGSSASWNIRGFTGLTIDQWGNYVSSSRKPLILVDGVEQNPDVLNPEDIESVSVLKDAAASAIYGSRAPYGVVLITTKSGKSGQVKLNYNNNFSWNSMIGVPEPVDGLTFANAFNEGYFNSRQSGLFTPETIAKIEAYMNGTGPSNSIIESTGLWGQWGEAHGNTNWMDELFKDNAFSQSHNMSMNGGLPDGKLDYYASVGYSEENGLLEYVPEDKYNRYNFSLKVTSKITDWLETTANVRYSQRNYERSNVSDYTVLNAVGRLWSVNPATNPDGVNHKLNKSWELEHGGGYSDVRDDLTSRMQMKITPFKGFNVVGNIAYSKYYRKYQRNWFNYQIPLPNETTETGGSNPNMVEERMSNDSYMQVEAYMSYERSFGDHFGKVMVGHQNEEKKYHELYGSKKNLITQEIPSISTATGVTNVDDGIGHWSTEGYFFRFNYNYKEKYLFEINSRYDASSRFPSDTRWALFPSFSAGWNVAKENFWPIEQVSSFKLRGSYGKLGNANVSNYLYLPQMNYSNKIGVMLGGENISKIDMPGIISPDITWEKPEVINIGFDASAFNNRLNVSYEWYQRTIKDQLAPPEEASKLLGTNPPRLNNGESETRGWEFSIGWRDKLGTILGKEVKYEANFNISDYIGYIVSFPNTTGTINGIWTAGEKFGEIMGYETVGIAQNIDEYNNAGSHHRLWSQYWYAGDVIYKDQDGDGKIDQGNQFWNNKGDLVSLGNTTPRYQYGINLRAEWNNFDIDMFFEGVGKQDLTMSGMYFWGLVGSQWHSSLFEHNKDYWTPENTTAYLPRVYMGSEAGKNQKTQSRYIIDGAYLRFKTLNIGYNLPSSWLEKTFIDRCRVYTSVENLAVLYNASGLDLDPSIVRSGNGQIYPAQRTLSFGLNVNF